MPFLILATLGATSAAVWYLLDYVYIPKHLPNEPPMLPSRIPYIGHIMGLAQHGTRYFEITR